MTKKKYAAVGIGGRIPMFIDPIADRFSDSCELVGLCDTSLTRAQFHQKRLTLEYGIEPVPVFEDFDVMIRTQKPEVVIVCTPDYLHHEFIVRSLEAGADVISEKPLTTDAAKFAQIDAAVKRTGRRVRTTFNYRWAPGVTKVREVIASGEIGRVKHVDFEYLLNTAHGADYFRRWHSKKEFSGGLLIHKATHHFDLVNWWIDGIPAQVYAQGDLVFYGRENAVARGDERYTGYARYTGTTEAENDPFRLNLETDPSMLGLYRNAEAESGYIRDQNVFRDGIDIEDTMSLIVKYRTGETLSYSLNAFCPREGFRAAISGDRGRIEYEEFHASHIITGGKEIPFSDEDCSSTLIVQKHFSAPYEVEIPHVEGGHGGADPMLQQQIFSPNPPPDPLMRNAGHEQGGASFLIGAAGNESMKSGLPISLGDLVSLRPEARRLHELI
jgi:predicted dehydrogenase